MRRTFTELLRQYNALRAARGWCEVMSYPAGEAQLRIEIDKLRVPAG